MEFAQSLNSPADYENTVENFPIYNNSRWSLRHILYHNLIPTLYTFFFSLLDDFFSSTCSSLYSISYMYKTLFHASIRNKTNTYHCLFSTDTNWCYIQMCRKILMKFVILKNKCPTTQKRTADIVYRSQQRAYGTKASKQISYQI